MMRPRPCGIMSLATDCATKKAPRRFVSRIEVPVVPRDVDRRLSHVAAGVVHEDVDAPERLRRVAHHAADAALVAHVELQRNRAASEALDFLLERLQRIERAAGDGEIGARARERPARMSVRARGSRR